MLYLHYCCCPLLKKDDGARVSERYTNDSPSELYAT